MVLATTFSTETGESRLIDSFSMRRGGREQPLQELLRVIEGIRGRTDLKVRIAPRFAMDAALLLIPSSGFCAYDDPRAINTVREVSKELFVDGLLLRYRTDLAAADGLSPQREGRFLACTFWLAECLAQQGQLEQARNLFDRAAATRNDLGLFAEEFEPSSHELLGNFPQGLTHLSHVVAAVAICKAVDLS